MPISHTLRLLVGVLRTVQKGLESCIHLTASGSARNKMCDANIHLHGAIALLEELAK